MIDIKGREQELVLSANCESSDRLGEFILSDQ